MRRLLATDDFARLATDKDAVSDAAVYRFSTATADLTRVDGRSIPYVFSDGSVARDGHTINQSGWDLTAYLRNPVFLFGHDGSSLPIGKVNDIGVSGGMLRGTVEYAERDLYPFADTVFQMVKQGFLSAVSTAWMPLKWKFSTDKNRMGGIDFLEQELLENSQVPVPALATALAEARSAGIDTGPAFAWAERILDSGGMIMVPRAQLETLRRNAEMPKPAKKTKARKITPETKVRGLYAVSALGSILSELSWLEDDVEWEAEWEQDGSDIPARLTEVLNALGKILIDMTIEEVNELLAVEAEEDVGAEAVAGVISQAAKTPAQRFLLKLGTLSRRIATPAVETRAGKVLSRANIDELTAAMAHHADGVACVQRVLDSAAEDDPEDPAEEVDDTEERSAKALAESQTAELDLLKAVAA